MFMQKIKFNRKNHVMLINQNRMAISSNMQSIWKLSFCLFVLSIGITLGAKEYKPEKKLWPYADGKHVFWMPEKTSKIKGVIVQAYYGWGEKFPESSELRELATEMSFGILRLYRIPKEGKKQWDEVLEILKNIAKITKHPEIDYAPLFVWGHSNGTGGALYFAGKHPERVFGWMGFKTAYCKQLMVSNAYSIPGIVISGQKDVKFYTNQKKIIEKLRKENNTLMAIIVEPDGEHGAMPASHKIVGEWIKTVFKARVPENADTTNGPVKLIPLDISKGWLGSHDKMAEGHGQPGFDENFKNGKPYIAPYADYSKDKSTASFLPTKDFAEKWQEYVETGDLK